ncbi:MAG: hypothetical protein NXH82_04585 [Rhodobacteraceae bacterium]|nr:hypothetical protein [Paracoccaceae bacterium]
MTEFVVWALFTVATVIPMLKLLPHFGLQKAWAALWVLPVGALILLWVMAMKLQDMERR